MKPDLKSIENNLPFLEQAKESPVNNHLNNRTKMETVIFRNEKRKLFSILLYGELYRVVITKEEYHNGQLALWVWEYKGNNEFKPFGTLTINLTDPRQTKDKAFVKNYSENTDWAERLAEEIGGINTGKTCQAGYATVPLYDFSNISIIEE